MKKACDFCLPGNSNKKRREFRVHSNHQDRTSQAWLALLQLIDEAAADKREVFDPKAALGDELWHEIETLPEAIAKLTNVKELYLYGSQLSRIPREIGAMKSLQKFTPYTSYRLHWLPYEITRCMHLTESTVSTRALYGNIAHRPPFPRLRGNPIKFNEPAKCSICDKTPTEQPFNQVWISLWVATDVLPLLAHVCSKACHDKIPPGANNYITRTHKGGLGLVQPPVNF